MVSLSGRISSAHGRLGMVLWLSSTTPPSDWMLKTRTHLSSVTATACCWSFDTVSLMMLVRVGGAFAVVFCFFAGRSSPSASTPLLLSTGTVPYIISATDTFEHELVTSPSVRGQQRPWSTDLTYGAVCGPLRDDRAIVDRQREQLAATSCEQECIAL